MAKRNTREILVNEGVNAFLARGYEGIGIQQILAAVGVPKGSFYNHFDSKEAFALEVLDAYDRRYVQFVEAYMSGTDAPLTRLRSYFAALEAEMSDAGTSAGCLYGVLSQTSAPYSELLRKRLKKAFSAWRENLSRLLNEAQNCGQLSKNVNIASLPDAIIDAYEGALLRMRAEGDIEPIRRFRLITLECLLASATDQNSGKT